MELKNKEKQRLEAQEREKEEEATKANNVKFLCDKEKTDIYPCQCFLTKTGILVVKLAFFEKYFLCEHCADLFLSFESRLNHMKKDHKDKLKKMDAKESDGEGSDDEQVSPTKIIKEKVQKKRLRSSRR